MQLQQPQQFQTRGIYRPNAQRLSISLAPLVAQRSLLFRIKADLTTKAGYGQLTPTSEESPRNSPALFILSATTAKSAKILSAAVAAGSAAALLSAALTSAALSTASVWSQESWKGETSPFSFELQQVPIVQGRSSYPDLNDNRRHAVAFSPSVNWNDMALVRNSNDNGKDSTKKPTSPLVPFVQVIVASPRISTAGSDSTPNLNGILTTVTMDSKVTLASLQGGPASTLKAAKKNKASEEFQKRVSKHSKAFGKAIASHLSMQPSKVTNGNAGRRQTTGLVITHTHMLNVPDYSLPPLKASISPIRMSFITKAGDVNPFIASLSTISSPTALPAITLPEAQSQVQRRPHYQKRSQLQLQVKPASVVPALVQQLAAPTHSRPPRSLPPPSLSLNGTTASGASPSYRKGHRRYQSSPAVSSFYLKGWQTDSVPPVPVVPAGVAGSVRSVSQNAVAQNIHKRARSHTNGFFGGEGGHATVNIRAVTPPFPAVNGAKSI